jgi:hypothetical protein
VGTKSAHKCRKDLFPPDLLVRIALQPPIAAARRVAIRDYRSAAGSTNFRGKDDEEVRFGTVHLVQARSPGLRPRTTDILSTVIDSGLIRCLTGCHSTSGVTQQG